MNIDQRKNILAHLAKNFNEASQAVIKKEVAKINIALTTDAEYEKLKDNLELLDSIAYRVHEDAVDTIREFLIRIKTAEVDTDGLLSLSNEAEKSQRYKNSIAVKALEVLEHIRYHEPYKILEIFFECSVSEEDTVTKKAIQGLERFSEYNLDIFYGNEDGWQGLGCQPQERALEVITSFDVETRVKYFHAILSVCMQLLSPTIEGSTWSYNKLNMRTAAIPVYDGMKKIRANTVELIKELYSLAGSPKDRKSVISTLNQATHTHHVGANRDVLEMIVEDSISVLRFYKELIAEDTEDLQILQTLEHDTYWLFYHKGELSAELRTVALGIRDDLSSKNEYCIYRVLIGFESVFHEWERDKGQKHDDDYDNEKYYRESEALKFAQEIKEQNYEEWKSRILAFASIESRDLATFPYFGKFLEYFSENAHELASKLLSEHPEELERFLVAILVGMAKSNQEFTYDLIGDWCAEGKQLFSLARFFEYHSEIDEKLLTDILDKAKEKNDISGIIQVAITVAAKFTNDSALLLKTLLIPSIRKLTELDNANWIYGFWFRKQRVSLIAALDEFERQALLDNLIILNKIEYQAEDILAEIAKHDPVAVVDFFCERIAIERRKENQREYDAVPFEFRKVDKPLSVIPDEAVDAVKGIYDGNYGMFIFQGANILSNIFKEIPDDFVRKLVDVLSSGEEDDLLFVLAILRSYDGNPRIQPICKELVKQLPEENDLLNEISVALESTGVLSGEYGRVEAYKRKIEEISEWLDDEEQKVKNFAENYIAYLSKYIDRETKRVDEEILLRKHQYGDDDE